MFSYKPFFKLLIDRDLTREQVRKKIGASLATFAKLPKGEPVSLEIIGKICGVLGCRIEDVIEYIPDDADDKE